MELSVLMLGVGFIRSEATIYAAAPVIYRFRWCTRYRRTDIDTFLPRTACLGSVFLTSGSSSFFLVSLLYFVSAFLSWPALKNMTGQFSLESVILLRFKPGEIGRFKGSSFFKGLFYGRAEGFVVCYLLF